MMTTIPLMIYVSIERLPSRPDAEYPADNAGGLVRLSAAATPGAG